MFLCKKMGGFVVGCGLALGILSCSGGGDSGGDSSDNDVQSTAAAIAAVFGTGESASINKITLPEKTLALFVKVARAQTGDDEDTEGEAGERNTCDDPDGNGLADGPQEVTASLSGTPGTYGDAVSGQTLTLDEEDFCQDSDGNSNSGDGADEGGLVASYTLASDVEGECDDGTTLTMKAGSDSAGVWRNTDDCFPEIFGNFEMGDGTIVSCHICLTESAGISGSNTSCSSSGSAISLSTDVTCELSTTEDEEEDTEDTEDTDGTGEEADAA